MHRGIADATAIPLSTLHEILRKEMAMKKRNNFLKPYLQPHHLTHRFSFAAAMLEQDEMRYNETPLRVHIDEKWFYLMEENDKI